MKEEAHPADPHQGPAAGFFQQENKAEHYRQLREGLDGEHGAHLLAGSPQGLDDLEGVGVEHIVADEQADHPQENPHHPPVFSQEGPRVRWGILRLGGGLPFSRCLRGAEPEGGHRQEEDQVDGQHGQGEGVFPQPQHQPAAEGGKHPVGHGPDPPGHPEVQGDAPVQAVHPQGAAQGEHQLEEDHQAAVEHRLGSRGSEHPQQAAEHCLDHQQHHGKLPQGHPFQVVRCP